MVHAVPAQSVMLRGVFEFAGAELICSITCSGSIVDVVSLLDFEFEYMEAVSNTKMPPKIRMVVANSSSINMEPRCR